MAEQRKTERIFARIPVRVRGLDELGTSFSEDTTTLEINRDGARIALKSTPRYGAALEITNLAKNVTAPSLVTHRCPQSYSGLPEWGVEFPEAAADFWGIAFEKSKDEQVLVVSALLVCRSCGRKEMVNLSPAEYEGLGKEWFLSRACLVCGARTQWEVVARDEEEPAAAPAFPSSDAASEEVSEERRRARRLTLKAPLLVTASNGTGESVEAQDLSKIGISFTCALELEPGDRVQISVGHGVAEAPSVRKCLVVWRKPREKSGQYFYGVKFLD
jgi:hypothetical protein